MDDRDTDIARIRTWMHSVMNRRHWSAEHWARVAGTSATNITRFLRGTTHVPSTRTLARLSQACGSMPEIGQQLLSLAPADRAVPLYSAKDAVLVLLHGKTPSEPTGKNVITTMQEVSVHAFAVEVSSRRMELHGIVPHDIVVCEPVAVLKPQPGRIVLYAVHAFKSGEDLGDFFELGVFQPPHITHHSTNAPEVVAVEDVTTIGVALEVRRSLDPGGIRSG